jgi:hypothetical protein
MEGPFIALGLAILAGLGLATWKLLEVWKQHQFTKAHTRTQGIIAAYKTNQEKIATAHSQSPTRLGADMALASTLDHTLVCPECSAAIRALATKPQ